MRNITKLFFVLTVLFLSSCLEDNINYTIVLPDKFELPDAKYSDLSNEVKEFIPEAAFDNMQKSGMPIHTGTTPPMLDNTYLISKMILLTTTVQGDTTPGTQFLDLKVKFYEFNSTSKSLKVSYINGEEEGSGLGGYAVGNSDNFTVFAKLLTYAKTDSALISVIYSGTLASGGAKNMHYCVYMIDNYGNPNDLFIENDESRVLYDLDKFSEETTGVKSLFDGLLSGGLR